MSEQSERNGSSEPSDSSQSGSSQSGSSRSDSQPSDSSRSGPQRSGSARQRPSTPASDMLSDLQRRLLRASARSMSREVSSQVRRTLGGGRQQASAADVWDTATNEIPPEVGESPECQWCPICRAARRMREAGPGLGGQLSGAGDAVATVVQDAIGALDSILSRAAGSDERTAASKRPASGARSASAPAATGRRRAESRPDKPGPGAAHRDGAGHAGVASSGTGDAAADGHDRGVEDPHASVAGEHGPGGWKAGDRLATEHAMDPDPWAGAMADDDGADQGSRPEKEAGDSPQGPAGTQPDGHQHEPDDRG